MPDNEFYADDRDQDGSDDNRPIVTFPRSGATSAPRGIAVPEPDLRASATLESVEVAMTAGSSTVSVSSVSSTVAVTTKTEVPAPAPMEE